MRTIWGIAYFCPVRMAHPTVTVIVNNSQYTRSFGGKLSTVIGLVRTGL
jgi:hypothetical protein